MFGDWVVSVGLRFSSNGAATMERLASSAQTANDQLLRQQGLIDANAAAWNRYSRKIEEVRLAQQRFGTMFAGGVAAVGAMTIGYGLKQAADLQTSITSAMINAPGLSEQAIRSIVMRVSSGTAQSATTIAEEFATAASSGLTGKQLTQGGLFQKLAYGADVLNLGPKHLDPVNTIKQLTQFAHMFGAYKGVDLNDMLESAVKMMSMQPEGLQQMLTQGRVFVGDALSRGVSMDEIFRQYMLMGQTALLKGRGGSGIENFMDYLQGAESITNHMSTVRRGAFSKLDRVGKAHAADSVVGSGMFDSQGRLRFVDEKGNLSLEKAERYLADLRKYMTPGEFANTLLNAFGKQGAQFANIVTRPSVQEQNRLNQQKWGEIAPISEQWARYMNTFNGQFQLFATNFKNVVIDIFTPELPQFTAFFRTMGKDLADLGAVLTAHPGMAKGIGDLIIDITTIAGIRFGIGIAQLGLNIAGLARSIDFATKQILVDRGLLDGSAVVGIGGGAAAGAERAGARGFLGKAWSTIDNLLFGGLATLLAKSAMKAGGAIIGGVAKVATGIEGFGPWIVRLGRNIGLVSALGENSVLGWLGRLIVGIGGASTLLGGAIGGLIRTILGPIGTVLSLSGDSGPQVQNGRVWSNVYGRWMSPQDLAGMDAMRRPVSQMIANGRKLQAGQAFDNDRRARVTINGGLHLVMPRGSTEQQGAALLNWLATHGGSFVTSGTLPNPLTVPLHT